MQFHCIKWDIQLNQEIFSKKKPNDNNNNDNDDDDVELTTPQKRYISPEERQEIIDELRLVPKN